MRRTCDDMGMTDADAIRALIDAQVDAFRRKDAAAAIALLSDDVVAFEMIPPLAVRPGGARDEQAMAAWFASWEGPIEIEIRDLTIHVDGDVGFAHSLNHLAGTRIGGASTDIWMRSTMGFRRTGDGWRLTHAHNSVPFDPADGFRAQLDLTP